MNRFRKARVEAPSATDATPQQADPAIPDVNKTETDISSTPPNTEVEKDVFMYAKMHAWDPNMDSEKLNAINQAVEAHDQDAERAIAHEMEESSPYPEVNSAVPLGDDPSIPANTVRAWFLGMVFVTFGSGLNMLFSLRAPSISISSIVAQLCAYPIGVAMAKWLPTRKFSFFGIPWSLNPGPFNKKEHCLITIMANVSFGGGAAYSTLTIEAMRGFYGMNWGVGFGILFTLCTQMTGLGLAGLFRKWLVTPSAMIWPLVLPNCALFQTLHEGNAARDPATTNGWSISRFRFFSYVLVGGFLWYFFPGYLFQALSTIAWVTWIKPNNVLVNQLFGGFSGMSLFPPTVFTLDWTMVASYLLSPLMAPWHAIANTMIGCVFFTWVVAAAINFSGKWYSDYLPFSDSSSYTNMGTPYKVREILSKDFTLDLQKYKNYSPIFLSTTFALQYGLSFATIISVVVHTCLFNGKEIWLRARNMNKEPLDCHMRLMKQNYREVPQWWFMGMFAVMIGLGFWTCLGYDTKLTWWGYILAITISAGWMIPIGMIQAITNIQIGLNVFTEYVISYLLPGRPIAMMVFKTLGYITMSQGLTYASDQKMGYYMKVPPRTLFFGQLVATAWSCFVQIGVLQWAFANITGICTPKQASHFICPGGKVFFNASIIWGVIGPQRMFAASSTYGSLQYFWLLGALLPVVFWLIARRWPRSPARYLNAPVILGGTGAIPPAVPMNYLMWGAVGFVFNKYIKGRYRGWWSNYNYVLSASLDAGLALSTILIFLALGMTKVEAPSWWGNNVVTSTLDNMGTAVRKTLPEGEKFGPTSW
ncbi:hypothetical protein FKW77_006407 [Venturia effusa]|uniref:OPT family small oligopeptide transporter n=1 Tax=Venturia effusa TaxID=50376 RepID=A0A517LP33_9PEZI|nr:hypothetical protein FKW77_006407 [Venturia effusa]